MTVEQELARIRNEIIAQKSFAKIPNGALDVPDDAPTRSWSGSINLNSGNDPLAKWRATFTRTDGRSGAPLVQFAFDYTYSPTRKDYLEGRGNTITAKDFNADEEMYIFSGVSSTSTNSVQFDIWIKSSFSTGYATANFNVTVQALSPVVGTLTLVKV